MLTLYQLRRYRKKKRRRGRRGAEVPEFLLPRKESSLLVLGKASDSRDRVVREERGLLRGLRIEI